MLVYVTVNFIFFLCNVILMKSICLNNLSIIGLQYTLSYIMFHNLVLSRYNFSSGYQLVNRGSSCMAANWLVHDAAVTSVV